MNHPEEKKCTSEHTGEHDATCHSPEEKKECCPECRRTNSTYDETGAQHRHWCIDLTCTCHSQPDTKVEDWGEAFKIFSRHNEWHPDATPLDVRNFISNLIEKVRQEERNKPSTDIQGELLMKYRQEGIQVERKRIAYAVDELDANAGHDEAWYAAIAEVRRIITNPKEEI